MATKKKTPKAKAAPAEASPYALDLVLTAPMRHQLLTLIPQTAGSHEEQFAIEDLLDAVGFTEEERASIEARQKEHGEAVPTLMPDDLPELPVALTELQGRALALGHYQFGQRRQLGRTRPDLALSRALRPALNAYYAEQDEQKRQQRERMERLQERAARAA